MGVSQADKKSMKEISFAQAQQAGQVSCEDALAIYDALEPIDTDFMLAPEGEGFATGHPLDKSDVATGMASVLTAPNTYPLVFRKASGKLTTVKPMLVMPGLGCWTGCRFCRIGGKTFQFALPLSRRRSAPACMIHYRGKTSATMSYDNLPINDVFRKVDDNTVLGIMDLKGMKQPFFFVLRRDGR